MRPQDGFPVYARQLVLEPGVLNRMNEYFRYLPISLRDQQWGLCVVGAGFQPVLPRAPYPPVGHPSTHKFIWERGRVLNEFGVIYIVRGKGEFESKAAGHRDLSAGDLVLVFPQVWHRYRPIFAVGWEVYWVHFMGADVDRLQEHKFIGPEEPVLTIGIDDVVVHAFVELLDRLRADTVGLQRMIAADCMQILAAALAISESQRTDSRALEQVRQAKALLEKDSQDTPSMDGIAAELSLSHAQFFRLFKVHTGLTPYQYYLQLKIIRARSLLANPDLTVQQIARTLGFRNVYQFSKFFKNKIGMAPTQWRHNGCLEPDVNRRKKRKRPVVVA